MIRLLLTSMSEVPRPLLNKTVLNSCGMTVSILGQEQENDTNENPEMLVVNLQSVSSGERLYVLVYIDNQLQ